MKALLSLIIFSVLSVAGYTQTRNVLVGTNSVVVQPTNFWSADAPNARTGLGLVLPALTNTNNAAFRSSIGLGSAATNATTDFQPPSSALSNLVAGNGGALTNIQSGSLVGIIPATNIGTVNFSNVGGTLAISSGGTSATNTAQARTNLGLGWSALTNTTASGFITALYGVGTNPVLTDSNGNVVSPTNFVWSGGGGSGSYYSRIQSFPSAATHDVTNGSHVLVYSFSGGTTNATNTLDLPTTLQSATNGDMVTVVHLGTTSSLTGIRLKGNATNFATINRPNESLRFIYDGLNWVNFPSQAQNSPIYFSGTNPTLDAATSRTNLGLGWSVFTNTNAATFNTQIGLGSNSGVTFGSLNVNSNISISSNISFGGTLSNGSFFSVATNQMFVSVPIVFSNSTNTATTRTNLGLGSTWLTNTDITNFRSSIFPTYTGPFRLLGINSSTNDVTWLNPESLALNILPPVTNAGYLLAVNATTNGVEWIPVPPSLITFPIAIAQGGTGGTNAAQARTNLGIPLAAFTNTTTTNFNNAIGLGPANNVTFGAATIGGTTAMSNATVSGTLTVTGTSSLGPVSLASDLPITEGGTGASSASAARNNLGLGTAATQPSTAFAQVANSLSDITNTGAARTNLGIPLAALTNTSVTNFRTAINLGRNSDVEFGSLVYVGVEGLASQGAIRYTNAVNGLEIITQGGVRAQFNATEARYYEPINFDTAGDIATTRSNLGIGIFNDVQFQSLVLSNSGSTATITVNGGLVFSGSASNSAILATRTNLGLGGGITTNISVLISGGGTNTLRFNNGILTNVTSP